MPAVSPRRVMLTADAVGGVWRYALELAGGLVAHGTETVLAVLGPPPTDAQRAEACDIVRLIETGLPLDWTADNEQALARASSELSGLASCIGAELVQLHAPAFAGLTRWPVPVVSVAHSCLGTWWRAVRGTDLPDDFAWRVAATARGLRASEAVIAPSYAFADLLRATYGDDIVITVIHNGRRAPPETRATRQLAVLTVGRLWDDGKNVVTLDRVANRLHAPIYAAGPMKGPNGAAVSFQNLHWLDELDEATLQARYAEMTIFAAPALYEPFGLGVLEAAQSGMSLVLSDIPTFRELWDGPALFVTPRSEDEWLRSLGRLIDDPEIAARHGALARERARSYTVEAMVEGTEAVYRAVLPRNPVASVA
ncbi:MAG: glycosyltransferase family 4 protein [Alphaproteobacteria bacterium]|nr:glycosyltransferase family 4 protein [Alphaproteobacteria bacterium]